MRRDIEHNPQKYLSNHTPGGMKLIVCLIPIESICGEWTRLIPIFSLVRVPAEVLIEHFSRTTWVWIICTAVQTGRAIPMQQFAADFKHRMRSI